MNSGAGGNIDELLAQYRKDFRVGSPTTLVISFAVVFLVWTLWAVSAPHWAIWAGAASPDSTQTPPSTAAAGAWGDSFGAFNALAAALGFGAVVITLNLQFRSLESQKVDQHIIQFEVKFFQLIDLLMKLRSELVYEQTPALAKERPDLFKGDTQIGHLAIQAAFTEVQYFAFKTHRGKPIRKAVVAGIYNNYVHNRFEYCFAPYFRMVYTILYGIRFDAVLSEKQKEYYGNIIRAQFTSFEIALLAINATSQFSKDLADLVIYFRMLKYLPRKRRKVLGDVFPPVAYEARPD